MRNIFGTSAALAALVLATVLAGCEDSPTGPSPEPCSYTLSASRQSFSSEGGSAAVTVTTLSHCAWDAAPGASWITVQGAASGVGTGTVGVAIAANPSEQSRTGSLTIAGQTLSMTQDGRVRCTFDVSPQKATYAADGGNGTLHVTTAASCAWTATTTGAWLTITSGAQGQGEGDVVYAVAKNTETRERSGTIMTAGQPISIEQAAAQPPPPPPPPPPICDYSVSPVEFVLHWHHTGGQINMTTPAGCSWTVTAGADWLTIATPGARSGADVIRFANSIYTADGRRRAPVEVRWPTPTAGQNVWVTQEGCRYGISESARDFPAGGGSATMYVVTQAVSEGCPIPCPWTATPLAPWIHVTSSMPRAGDDRFIYEVDANTTGQPRIGQIRVETQTVTVRQAAQAPTSEAVQVLPHPAGMPAVAPGAGSCGFIPPININTPSRK